jgi:hypothetical protein
VVVGFELSSSPLLGRHSTAGAIPPSLFAKFNLGILLFAQAGLELQLSYLILPAVIGIPYMHNHAWLFPHWDGVLKTFSPGFTWNLHPIDISLLCSMGWQVCVTVTSYCLRWDLVNFLPRLPSNTILPISVS